MKLYHNLSAGMFILFCAITNPIDAKETDLPDPMKKIMDQPKYKRSSWGIFARDSGTGEVLYELNSEKMTLPGSTTKLFSVAALLHAYGYDFRFKTPVYAIGTIQEGKLDGNIILVGQGDLTFGGRQRDPDTISYTNLDHTIANYVPGAKLTPEDPLQALISLARQIKAKGINTIDGNIVIDDRLFQTIEKRGTLLSPILINENLIDIIINPTEIGKSAALVWRPKVEGYSVINEVKTVKKGSPKEIHISSDEFGNVISVKGTISEDDKNLVQTFSIKNANHFARAAFIDALKEQGIKINLNDKYSRQPSQKELKELDPLAVWSSPPLYEYAKLILKVSHNIGANLTPLLLAAKNGKTSYDDGMLDLGNFVINVVKVPEDAFVFTDAAGADDNRLTPKAVAQLLNFAKKLPKIHFQNFYDALPILGVDGSLADFGKETDAVGKIRAKTGTGISTNVATRKLFLTTQTMAGYIEGKKGNLIEFMIAVNNGNVPTINDMFPVFEDIGQMAAIIYNTEKEKDKEKP